MAHHPLGAVILACTLSACSASSPTAPTVPVADNAPPPAVNVAFPPPTTLPGTFIIGLSIYATEDYRYDARTPGVCYATVCFPAGMPLHVRVTVSESARVVVEYGDGTVGEGVDTKHAYGPGEYLIVAVGTTPDGRTCRVATLARVW